VVAQNIAFGLVAAAMILAALRMVTTQNVVHAALYLVVVLAGVGAPFILLAAEFIAVVQIIVYVGAIVVLILFGVMLTRARIGKEGNLDNDQRWAGLVTALFLFGVLAYALLDSVGDERILEEAAEGDIVRTSDVGLRLFAEFLIPFQAVGILLLATLVGAVVIARRD
jgi:NADH-quinone oxidoreductase subunit J